MCYSAMIEQAIQKAVRRWGADVDYAQIERLVRERIDDRFRKSRVKFAKAFEANFYQPEGPAEERIKALIDEFNRQQETELEEDLFRQRKRLADAERTLAIKPTKKALEDQRIATNKVAWNLDKLGDLKRTELKEKDSRIFPFWHAPVILMENGRMVIRPMRYHCRPCGKPESYDRKYDGLYNARRDNLEGFWKNNFGKKHAIVVATSFYENVALNDFEQRELRPGEKPQNLVLHFDPKPRTEMLLACMWDRWTAPGEPDLYSFAAITDEPPPEVAAAGHDRCVIPIREANLGRWLTPEGRDLADLYAVLDDRERPYYEHRLAA